MLRVAEHGVLSQIAGHGTEGQRESGAWLNSLPVPSLGNFWTPRALGLPLPLEWGLVFVFLILAAAAGGWTVVVCMVCPANTVLAVFQGIRQ